MFTDRRSAGRLLADRLAPLANDDRSHTVVLGLPRGGVPVAREVANRLHAPLDVIVVRKLGAPGQPELAMGAVGEDHVRVLNRDVVAQFGVSAEQLEAASEVEWREVERRAALYQRGRPRLQLTGRTAIVVDDGIATGATTRAACAVARAYGAAHVVLAVPVAPRGWEGMFEDVTDQRIALETPRHFMAVGVHYEDFRQTSDDEVIDCLRERPASRRAIRDEQ
ncbi:MAG TPA: phosphoribosyltransferase [Actinomycetes bacterium]|nr:phosphoribosyltransferase [Actinomycetes bacterium]